MRFIEGEIEGALSAIERVWRDDRRLSETTIAQYRGHFLRFLEHCRKSRLRPRTQLTHEGATRFARRYVLGNLERVGTVSVARTAVKRAAETLRGLGETLPRWISRCSEDHREAPILKEYAAYLRQHGRSRKTVTNHLWHLDHLLKLLRRRRRALRGIRLEDIDALIEQRRRHCSLRTLVDVCHVARSFLRFLHVSARLKRDLSQGIRAPVRTIHRPPRALPWQAVQRILRGIKRTSVQGCRDYAMLLMMSTYGCGAGELIRLRCRDIDWQGRKLRLVRPKTGNEILLPLLPAVARALADYLRGRPTCTSTEAVFVRLLPPYVPLSSSSAVRHSLQRHAQRAGVRAAFLGSHALRHTHACRQMQIGTRTKLIGDILGHRDPESTSAYLRVSIEHLRRLALPVPR